jgi:predicted nucleic acid-binding protein
MVQKKDPNAVATLTAIRERLEAIRAPAAVWIAFLSGLPAELVPRARRVLSGSVIFEAGDLALADRAAQLQSGLLRQGLRVGWHDHQIAATALHHAETLLTTDRAFLRIPGLDVQTVP